jgi:hypothetical protein
MLPSRRRDSSVSFGHVSRIQIFFSFYRDSFWSCLSVSATVFFPCWARGTIFRFTKPWVLQLCSRSLFLPLPRKKCLFSLPSTVDRFPLVHLHDLHKDYPFILTDLPGNFHTTTPTSTSQDREIRHKKLHKNPIRSIILISFSRHFLWFDTDHLLCPMTLIFGSSCGPLCYLTSTRLLLFLSTIATIQFIEASPFRHSDSTSQTDPTNHQSFQHNLKYVQSQQDLVPSQTERRSLLQPQ